MAPVADAGRRPPSITKFEVRRSCNSEDMVHDVCQPELVMGHFFKTQPNPKILDPTQPNTQKSPPDPTQPIIDTWYGILGYTENFLQQLLHVTDKFTVNDSY